MARISLISRICKTTLSYLWTGLACLAYALALQGLFECTTVGPQWSTIATLAGATLLAALIHYLHRLFPGPAANPFGPSRKLKVTAFCVGAALPLTMLIYQLSQPVVSTGPSQWQRLTLDDGSTVHLDARSKIKIEYSAATRIVRLYKGNALFEVAKDSKRPFIVRTASIDAIAVGTRFGVSINPGVTTTVSEGIVKVTRRGEVDDAPVSVSAGQELQVSDRSLSPQLVRVDAESRLDWANGWLTFTDSTIAEGVAELNRRNQVQIVVDSPALSATRLHGYFRVRVDTPERYAEIIAQQTGATVDKQDGVIRLKE